jgi:acyl dehydratase
MPSQTIRPGSLSFDDVQVGQILDGRMTVTESHMVLASGIFGDFAPLYVDAEFASSTTMGARPAAPALIAGIMDGVLSKWFGRFALGIREQSAQFRCPVFAGETVTTHWEVRERHPDAALGGGVVALEGECRKTNDVTAALAHVKLVVGVRIGV